MKRFVRWSLENIILGVFLYFGLVKGIGGALNIALVWCWLTSVIIILAQFSEDACKEIVKTHPKTSYDWLQWVVELVISGMFIWYGYIALGVVVLLARLSLSVIYERGRKAIERSEEKGFLYVR